MFKNKLKFYLQDQSYLLTETKLLVSYLGPTAQPFFCGGRVGWGGGSEILTDQWGFD